VLVVKGLSKSFPSNAGSAVHALNSINLSADSGDLVCILGPNGSGKTTFLKILAGLIWPDAGEATVAEHNVLTETRQIQTLTGFAPAADRSFYGRLSGLENLRFFAGLRGIDPTVLRERLASLKACLKLEEILPISYQKASSGMKQRLALARALIHGPAVLLLDEPLQNLDAEGAEKIRKYIRHDFLGQNKRLVLWSTQHPTEAWEIATRIIILRDGKILADGTPVELSKKASAKSPLDAYMYWCYRASA
jgi:ABC-2 type transport system ATP-binding protein